MYPSTCCACQVSLCHAKIEKISKKFFVMINKDGGGQFLDFVGGHNCYEGGHTAHGGSPLSPTKENPAMWLKKFQNGPVSACELFSSYLAQSSYMVRNTYNRKEGAFLEANFLLAFSNSMHTYS